MSDTVEKIKYLMSKAYADKFGEELSRSMNFIPIGEAQKGTFYAAINEDSNTDDIEPFPDQRPEAWNGEIRRPHENDSHCASSSGICPFISSSVSSLFITSIYRVPSR